MTINNPEFHSAKPKISLGVKTLFKGDCSFKNCFTIFEIPTGFRFLQSKQTELFGGRASKVLPAAKECFFGGLEPFFTIEKKVPKTKV
jgi:hypothetical protein